MTRNEARKAAEVMLAYAEGKEIEAWNSKTGWEECNEPYFSWCDCSNSYRIKPESKYRPFAKAEECWAEMQKHQPFGWVKGKITDGYVQVQYVMESDDKGEAIIVHFAPDEEYNEQVSFDNYTFADGAPFGILEEN